jgi:hypothetical protein
MAHEAPLVAEPPAGQPGKQRAVHWHRDQALHAASAEGNNAHRVQTTTSAANNARGAADRSFSRQASASALGDRSPAERSRWSLEGAEQVGCDPAAVEVAPLCLHAFCAKPCGIHAARVEGDVVAQRFVA